MESAVARIWLSSRASLLHPRALRAHFSNRELQDKMVAIASGQFDAFKVMS